MRKFLVIAICVAVASLASADRAEGRDATPCRYQCPTTTTSTTVPSTTTTSTTTAPPTTTTTAPVPAPVPVQPVVVVVPQVVPATPVAASPRFTG